MFARTIKKALGFFIVDILIIIGIFVLQFSNNDSIITEKNGGLQITLSETKDSSNVSVLKNQMQLAFGGITLTCDDLKPVYAVTKDPAARRDLKLTGWNKTSDNSYDFIFTEDVVLHIELSGTPEKPGFSVMTEIPPAYKEVAIPYSIASNLESSSETKRRKLLSSKKQIWEFLVPEFEGQYIRFNSGMPVASYSPYEKKVEFKFAGLVDSVLAGSYPQAVRTFRDSVISAFKGNSEAAMHEPSVVAYIAEQGSRGKYISALDDIPQSFKRSDSRTYLSAPFFNTLSEMNEKLENNIKSKAAMLRRAASDYSLAPFTQRNIAGHMYIYPDSSVIKKLTEIAGEANVQNCSLAEAAGILRTYVEMMPLSKNYASHMVDSLKACTEKIEKACKMEGNALTISENGTFLSVVQAVEIGDALIRYGQFVNDDSLVAGGKAIIASYLAEAGSFDIKTLSELYPVVVTDNHFYPHFQKLLTEGNNVIWAWTVAENISFERGEGGSGIFTIEYPLEYTHYVIIRGVSSFRTIYIYDIPFRTDPRFETYNSSGYVYKSGTRALLLKQRHKAEKEVVRLLYGPDPAEEAAAEAKKEEAPAVEAEVQAEVSTETLPAAGTPSVPVPAPNQSVNPYNVQNGAMPPEAQNNGAPNRRMGPNGQWIY